MLFIFIIFNLYCKTISTARNHNNCQFDMLYQLNQITDYHYQQIQQGLSRKLDSYVRSNIRITYHYKQFDLNNKQTSTVISFIKNALQVCEHFLQKRIKIHPLNFSIKAPQKCVDFQPAQIDKIHGISDSDLHIYIQFINSKDESWTATGKSCSYSAGIGNYPDPTLSRGRPVLGRIIFNLANCQHKELNNKTFAKLSSIAMHELMHILGMDRALYHTFLDSNTQNKYKLVDIFVQQQLNKNRPISPIIKTPRVTMWAQKHYGCNQISGMQLQNQGLSNSLGSHWQRSIIYDELMTATNLGSVKAFSGLTFSLLSDMGWYQVDGSFNDSIVFGRNKGCDFFNNVCYSTIKYQSQFCNDENQSLCSNNLASKSVCMKTKTFSDGCLIRVPSTDCNQQQYRTDKITFQEYSQQSKCIQSNLSEFFLSHQSKTRCYKVSCVNDSLTIKIKNQMIRCNHNSSGQIRKLSGEIGILKCPNYQQYCGLRRLFCQNWCSSNGYCTNGVCNCKLNFSGISCQNQGRNITSCQNISVLNPYDLQCHLCRNCLTCFGFQHICTSCKNKILFNSQCIQHCPEEYYSSVNNLGCEKCNQECLTCEIQPHNCIRCKLNYYYFKNKCIKHCPQYLIHNNSSRSCEKSCNFNQFVVNGFCQQCSNNTYLTLNKICVQNCSIGYFKNQLTKYCELCHADCQICASSKNCFKCKSPYINYQNSCLSECPLSKYKINNSCSQCMTNCLVCINQHSCNQCNSSNYLDNQSKCVQSCASTYFGDSMTSKCLKCDQSCLQCYGPSSHNCSSCQSNKVLFSTKLYSACLDQCPIEYYSNNHQCTLCFNNCLVCHDSDRNSCDRCKMNYYLSENTCYQICPIGSYESGSICEKCNQSCNACITRSKCTKCVAGMYLQNEICVASCSDGLQSNIYKICFLWDYISMSTLLILICAIL